MLNLNAIEQRANAATPGPWYWTDGKSKRCDLYNRKALLTDKRVVLSAESVCYGYTDQEEFVEAEPQDQDFIAHARTDIPALIARVRELEAIIEATAREHECVSITADVWVCTNDDATGKPWLVMRNNNPIADADTLWDAIEKGLADAN